jgi:transaldolase
MYVEQLIGPDTINTLPQVTLDAFQDHGQVARTIDREVEEARATMQGLAAVGISMEEVTDKLQIDGIAAFSQSLESIYSAISHKRTLLPKDQQQTIANAV